MLVEKNTNFVGLFGFISMSEPRMVSQQLRLFVNPGDGRAAASGSSAAM